MNKLIPIVGTVAGVALLGGTVFALSGALGTDAPEPTKLAIELPGEEFPEPLPLDTPTPTPTPEIVVEEPAVVPAPPAPAPAPPAPPSCPAGSSVAEMQDGVITFCSWDICTTLTLPDPAHPECDTPFRP